MNIALNVEQYIKKPVTIEAVQWDGYNTIELIKWIERDTYLH